MVRELGVGHRMTPPPNPIPTQNIAQTVINVGSLSAKNAASPYVI